MHYGAIKENDIANGPGIRVSLFVSGCRNHCPGCFQPETWDFKYGEEYTEETFEQLLDALNGKRVDGLSILGGDPFEKENQWDVAYTVMRVKAFFPEKNIWVYTGYQYEDLLPGGKQYTVFTGTILRDIDVLVDGPFLIEFKDPSLAFRGSANQRIINVPATIAEGHVVLEDIV